MIKGIIFDFDGVIVDSAQVKSDAFSELYKSYGSEIVRKIVKHHEDNGGISRFDKIEYYNKNFLNKTITEKEIMILAKKFSKLVLKKVITTSYIPGALQYIKNCYNRYNLFISTGTPTEEINQILESRGISKYFNEVFGSPSVKISHLKFILSKYNLKPDELIFYGDSKTDFDAAENFRIPFVLIKNRFNEKLSQNNNLRIINNFVGL